MTSPCARSLALLRREGFTAQAVERWNAHAGARQDQFGFIDLLAMREGEPPLAVQATSAGNVASRVKKALASSLLRTWLLTGARFEVWGWSKRGPRGERKLWACTRRAVTAADLPPAAP